MQIANARNVIYLNESQLNFTEIFAIKDPNAAKQAFAMAQLFQHAVVPKGTNELYFDIQKAAELVKARPDMALVEVVDQTITQSDSAVEVMVEQVLGLLNAILDIALNPTQTSQLTKAIENVFTNLAPQEGDAWIFWSKSEAKKTAYQYNITFAVQNEETGLFLYALPMGLTITADLDKEQVLFIKLKDKATYSVKVQSLKAISFLESEVERRAQRLLLSRHLAAA